MELTVGQLLQLVRHVLEKESATLSRNACLRRLAHLETQLGGRLGLRVNIPVEVKKERIVPSEDFSLSSPVQSEPEVEPEPVEDVPLPAEDEDEDEEKPKRRRYYSSKSSEV